jgi:hypothetical protein
MIAAQQPISASSRFKKNWHYHRLGDPSIVLTKFWKNPKTIRFLTSLEWTFEVKTLEECSKITSVWNNWRIRSFSCIRGKSRLYLSLGVALHFDNITSNCLWTMFQASILLFLQEKKCTLSLCQTRQSQSQT